MDIGDDPSHEFCNWPRLREQWIEPAWRSEFLALCDTNLKMMLNNLQGCFLKTEGKSLSNTKHHTKIQRTLVNTVIDTAFWIHKPKRTFPLSENIFTKRTQMIPKTSQEENNETWNHTIFNIAKLNTSLQVVKIREIIMCQQILKQIQYKNKLCNSIIWTHYKSITKHNWFFSSLDAPENNYTDLKTHPFGASGESGPWVISSTRGKRLWVTV